MIFDEVLALYPEISVTVHEDIAEIRDWNGHGMLVREVVVRHKLEFEYL